MTLVEHGNRIPKKIWFLWFQGLEAAPAIVQKCFHSWQQQNPGWELIFLSDENLSDYLRLNLSPEQRSNLNKAHISDLVRLKLLSSYGGVWVDATSFCMQPLDEWLEDYAPSGFFAFRNPGKDRLLSNWFLASAEGNAISTRLYDNLISYWQSNQFNNHQKDFLTRLLKKLLNHNSQTTKLWSSFLITKVLKVSPYYIFHYKFADLIARDPECQKIWNLTKAIEADPAHQLKKNIGQYTPFSQAIARQVDSLNTPVHKLNWKVSVPASAEKCVMDYLMDKLTSQAVYKAP